MCMEDVAIERSLKTRIYATATTIAIPANANRMSIRLTADQNEGCNLLAVTPPVIGPLAGGTSPVLGFCLFNNGLAPVTTGPVDCTLTNCGDLLKGPLSLQNFTLNGNLAYAVEVYLDVAEPKLK